MTHTSSYAGAIAGDVLYTQVDSDEATLTSVGIADPIGSVVATLSLIDVGGARTALPGDGSGLAVYDEYGNRAGAGVKAGALDYGWLGGKERASDVSGLVLMGVRLFNSVTGLFTSVDAVVGGNETVYGYPNDPISKLDLDGRRGWWSRSWSRVKSAASAAGRWAGKNGTIAGVIATAGCAVPAVGWAAYAGLQAGAYAVRAQQRGFTKKNLKTNLFDGIATAAGFGLISTPMRMAQYGRMGRAFYNPKGTCTRSWDVGKKTGWALSAGVAAPFAMSKTVALRKRR